MWQPRAQRSLQKAGRMTLDLLTGAYPRFVYGGRQREIPVFTTHGVEPRLFEAQLRFLRDNGYRTLTADELYAAVRGEAAAPARSVVLTYDDGLASLWSVGLPLLKRYGLKIVVFLIPGRIQDAGDSPLLTWEQIAAMHQSGLVDFQSHALTHQRVFCAQTIQDFYRPELARRMTAFQLPEWMPHDEPLAWGRPLYPSRPRLGTCRRYLEDGALRRSCETFVAERGGEAFFQQPGWRARLERRVRDFRAGRPDPGRYETDEERAAAIWEELRTSRRMIESRLPGKSVRHLAYPWGEDSALARAISAQAGYLTNFPAKVAGSYAGVRRGEPTVIGRFGMDFLFRLPGAGRWSLRATLTGKLVRNLVNAAAKQPDHVRQHPKGRVICG